MIDNRSSDEWYAKIPTSPKRTTCFQSCDEIRFSRPSLNCGREANMERQPIMLPSISSNGARMKLAMYHSVDTIATVSRADRLLSCLHIRHSGNVRGLTIGHQQPNTRYCIRMLCSQCVNLGVVAT